MVKSQNFWMFGVLLLLIAGGCYAAGVGGRCCPDGGDDTDAGEVEIPVDQIPAGVKAAAVAAVPGLAIEEADRDTEHGIVVYDIEGSANGTEYELEVTADGKVLEVEEHADKDDGEDDGEDDDGHDEKDDD